MAIFAIISQPNTKHQPLGAAIKAAYPDAFVLDGNAEWLVSAQTSAQNLSNQLSITEGENGAALIVEVASYYGRANPNTWTWFKEKMEAAANG